MTSEGISKASGASSATACDASPGRHDLSPLEKARANCHCRFRDGGVILRLMRTTLAMAMSRVGALAYRCPAAGDGPVSVGSASAIVYASDFRSSAIGSPDDRWDGVEPHTRRSGARFRVVPAGSARTAPSDSSAVIDGGMVLLQPYPGWQSSGELFRTLAPPFGAQTTPSSVTHDWFLMPPPFNPAVLPRTLLAPRIVKLSPPASMPPP